MTKTALTMNCQLLPVLLFLFCQYICMSFGAGKKRQKEREKEKEREKQRECEYGLHITWGVELSITDVVHW